MELCGDSLGKYSIRKGVEKYINREVVKDEINKVSITGSRL
jgi:hypothetical protein